MRRNHPKNARRNPYRYYDIIYIPMVDSPNIRYVVDRTRKLIIINPCADPAAYAWSDPFIEQPESEYDETEEY